MSELFPRVTVGGKSLPRLLIGTNWMVGWSHTGAAADAGIREKFQTPKDFYPVLHAYLERGIDAIMGSVCVEPLLLDGIHYAEDRDGKKITVIDTPTINVDDSVSARKEAESLIKRSAEIGSTFCLIHHVSVEQLVNKNKRIISRLPDYLSMIREAGLIPGCSAHMPEVVLYCDLNQYDVETYIQVYNCLGFMMQIEVENAVQIIQNADHPVMTIKSMAAGRTSPFVGLTFSWNTIRECDMVTVGAATALEAKEDIEYSLAAIEHRAPMVDLRGSADGNQDALKGKL